MKNKLLIYPLLVYLVQLIFSNCIAQSDTSEAHEALVDTNITIDLLIAPNSPGFTLLGISPDNVDRPETPSDFAVSVSNGTDNFTTLPKNYSLEFLPVNLLSRCYKSNDDFKMGDFATRLLQTFTVSTAFSTNDDADTTINDFIRTRSAIGIRFSIFNGHIDTLADDYDNALQTIRTALIELHDTNAAIMKSFRASDTGYVRLDTTISSLSSKSRTIALDQFIPLREQLKALNNFMSNADSSAKAQKIKIEMDSLKNMMDSIALAIKELNVELHDYIQAFKDKKLNETTDQARKLKKAVSESKFKRTGWMLDFAGGMVLGYRNDDFQNSVVQKCSFWLNGGHEGNGFNALAVARYSTNYNTISYAEGKKENESNFDAGFKAEIEALDKKFSFSLEGIARVFSDTTVFRYTINASYQVGANQALTFALGRDFAGRKQYGGNLIAALNYVKAFGTKRTIAKSR